MRDTIADRVGELSRASSTEEQRARWRADPVAWVRERLGEYAWSKQREILESVRDNPRTAVQSCHGVGKSHIGARVICWFVDTHDPGEIFIVSTAPTWSQVYAILWRYIRQVQRAAELPGYVTQQAEWKVDGELIGYGRKPADTDESGMQGLHAPEAVLAVIDEACGVRGQIWTAIDSLVTTDESRVLALGNPDTTSSHFHSVCTGQEPGWNVVRISALDSPNFTDEGRELPEKVCKALVRRSWVEDKRVRWGESSPLYRIKVLGEFADDTNALIPSSWIYEAQLRWLRWEEAGRPEPDGRRLFGVDVARFGDDSTAVATRQGDVILGVEKREQLDSVQVTAWVRELLNWPQSSAIVDALGIGGPVVDQLRHAGYSPRAYDGGAGTEVRDIAGILRFANVRSAAHWRMREALDPYRGSTLALPPSDDLMADLTAPSWEVRTGKQGSVIHVEPKEDVAKRLGRSPDEGDSVVMAMWAEYLPDPRGTDAAVLSQLTPRAYAGPPDADRRSAGGQTLRPRGPARRT